MVSLCLFNTRVTYVAFQVRENKIYASVHYCPHLNADSVQAPCREQVQPAKKDLTYNFQYVRNYFDCWHSFSFGDK